MGDQGPAAAPAVGVQDGGVADRVTAPPTRDAYVRQLLDSLRVLVVAGIVAGVLVAGVGSRLAMLMLRLTSSSDVSGIESDDGFTIGQVTLLGTYNLLMIGAVVGIIGAAAYLWVRPWLMGPSWFRRVTVGAGAGAVVGSMLVHGDGVDFVALTPTWLAIATFVALPALFGLVIGPLVDRVEQPGSWTRRGRTEWVLPLVLALLFPVSLLVIAVAAVVLALWTAVRRADVVERTRHVRGVVWAVRTTWFAVAAAGLVTLIGDVQEITALT